MIPGEVFLDQFASDRSHMKLEPSDVDSTVSAPAYRSPPPEYPPLRGNKAMTANNLMSSFVSMDSSTGFGQVMDLDEFTSWSGVYIR